MKNKTTKNIIILIFVLLILFGFYKLVTNAKDTQPYTVGKIHWHANFDVYLCGERQEFTKGYDFEEDRIGTLQLHTHNDNVIHIEDRVIKKEDIALGRFFDIIRIPFDNDKIMNKKNGDICPNTEKSGSVSMYVNGVENDEYRNFVPKPCTSVNIQQDCDKIEIKFE